MALARDGNLKGVKEFPRTRALKKSGKGGGGQNCNPEESRFLLTNEKGAMVNADEPRQLKKSKKGGAGAKIDCAYTCLEPDVGILCANIDPNAVVKAGSCIGRIYEDDENGEPDFTCKYLEEVEIGSVSCFGYAACKYMSDGSVVGSYSCAGSEACVGFYYSSKVGSGSCNDDDACSQLIQTSIGDGSCVDLNSCFLASYSTIGDGSCIGGYCSEAGACEKMGYYMYPSQSATVGDGSCLGEASCHKAGYYRNLSIGDSSCKGYNSCNKAGFGNGGHEVTIYDRACVGSGACYYIGYGGDVTVKGNSCQGGFGCYKASSVTIEEGSCIADYGACVYFNYNDKENPKTIGQNSCAGYKVCVFQSANIGSASCWGASACRGKGDEYVVSEIKSGSCVGYKSCYNIEGITVADNACIGVYACGCRDSDVGEGECIGDYACDACAR